MNILNCHKNLDKPLKWSIFYNINKNLFAKPYLLTSFSPMFHFYTPWKHQKNLGFQPFLGVWERNIGLKWVNSFHPLCVNPTKWPNTIKQFVGCCWRIVWVFDHFVGIALKRLKPMFLSYRNKPIGLSIELILKMCLLSEKMWGTQVRLNMQ